MVDNYRVLRYVEVTNIAAVIRNTDKLGGQYPEIIHNLREDQGPRKCIGQRLA
jgi:hypothetical protein